MSRTQVPFAVADSSALARSLREQLAKLERQPSHVELLNMLARAGGHRNFQQLRAAALAGPTATPAEQPAPTVDTGKVEQVLRHFDAGGSMLRWPARTNHQQLCLWAIWSQIPGGRRFDEAEINRMIIEAHSFGDHAILRRSLVDAGLVARTPDGRIYRRLQQVPPPEAEAVIAEVARRMGQETRRTG